MKSDHNLLLKTLGKVSGLVVGSDGLGKLLILIFHRVLQEKDFMRPAIEDIHEFSWKMDLLASYFNVLPLDVALLKLEKGELPPMAVCITFDDGYADNLINAVPILQLYGLHATFFISTGYLDGGVMWNDAVIDTISNWHDASIDLSDVGLKKYELRTKKERYHAAIDVIKKIKHLEQPRRQEIVDRIGSSNVRIKRDLMLTTEQLNKLHMAGMGIGGHTISHPILATLGSTKAEEEICKGKKELEDILDAEIQFFAYPNGKLGQDYLEDQRLIVEKCGFRAALTTEWGVADRGCDLFQLPRFTPWDNTPIKFMMRMLRAYNDKF